MRKIIAIGISDSELITLDEIVEAYPFSTRSSVAAMAFRLGLVELEKNGAESLIKGKKK